MEGGETNESKGWKNYILIFYNRRSIGNIENGNYSVIIKAHYLRIMGKISV